MNIRLVAVGVMTLVLLGAGPVTMPSTIPASTIGEDIVILGKLGLPIGEEVTISGRKRSSLPLPDVFAVDTINGHKAPPDTEVQSSGIRDWPDGTAATLRGVEVGTVRFLHLEETNHGGAAVLRAVGYGERGQS